jgi:hypothetical protein
MKVSLNTTGLPLLTRKGFMVQAMEIIDDWYEDGGVPSSNHDQYDLAGRLWELWESVVAMQKTLERANDGIKSE